MPRHGSGRTRFALFVLLSSASLAAAQDRPPNPPSPPEPGRTEPPQAPPSPAADAEPAPDPVAAAARIAALWERIATDPPPLLASEPDREKLGRVAAQHKTFKADLAAMCKAADDYARALAAAPGTAGDPRTLWQAAYGRARQAERAESLSREERTALRSGAADFLRAALDAAPKDAAYRADAEYWLGRMLLSQAPTGRATVPQAVEHLRTATLLFRRSTRVEESGRAALAALSALTARGMDAEAKDLAAAIGAATEDFGAVTSKVRVLGRRGSTGVGAPFPELPEMTDADGKPLRWAELRGAPFIVHFFHAAIPTGQASSERDVETLLRPLWDRLHERGLRMVGVSMDLALTKARVEEIERNWDEWGTKGKVQDGSLECVRRYAEDQGIAWPWIWDGTWDKTPVAQALGGPGASAAHAVLVDSGGIIRWRGDAPFTGLAEAVDAAVTAAQK